MSVIIFLIILAVLVLVHEFGHFIVAKKSGIRVDEFGLGFPPKIFAKKWGSTLYTLNAIPFGGFVKIFGEDSHGQSLSDEDKSKSFFYKPKWIQALVLVAGVTFNMIFAWLLISLVFMIGMPSSADSSVGQVKDVHLVITEILPDSPAQKAGLVQGDVIVSLVSLNNHLEGESLTPENVRTLISSEATKSVNITYERGNDPVKSVSIKPSMEIEGKKAIGIGTDNIGILKLPIHLAFIEGVKTTLDLTKDTIIGLGKFLWNIIIFKSDFSQITGPVGIAKVVDGARSLGLVHLLWLVALISINLAIINLIPFPALDGGRLLFVFIESIIRRPIKPEYVRWMNTLGFTFLIILMIAVTGHDIAALF